MIGNGIASSRLGGLLDKKKVLNRSATYTCYFVNVLVCPLWRLSISYPIFNVGTEGSIVIHELVISFDGAAEGNEADGF